ncbi:hypothetical protein Tco_1499884 [Tanacetum coccineum]
MNGFEKSLPVAVCSGLANASLVLNRIFYDTDSTGVVNVLTVFIKLYPYQQWFWIPGTCPQKLAASHYSASVVEVANHSSKRWEFLGKLETGTCTNAKMISGLDAVSLIIFLFEAVAQKIVANVSYQACELDEVIEDCSSPINDQWMIHCVGILSIILQRSSIISGVAVL